MVDCCVALVGHIKGGLGYANVLVSMLFAGISGSSQADTAGIGKILIPAMEEEGFPKDTAVGVTIASSTLGVIIPPSIPTCVEQTDCIIKDWRSKKILKFKELKGSKTYYKH